MMFTIFSNCNWIANMFLTLFYQSKKIHSRMIKVSREKKNTADRSECYEKEIPEWRPAVKRGDKLKKNLKVTFRIRMTSNRGHYFWKVTPNLPTYRSNPADLCTKIFNGI